MKKNWDAINRLILRNFSEFKTEESFLETLNILVHNCFVSNQLLYQVRNHYTDQFSAYTNTEKLDFRMRDSKRRVNLQFPDVIKLMEVQAALLRRLNVADLDFVHVIFHHLLTVEERVLRESGKIVLMAGLSSIDCITASLQKNVADFHHLLSDRMDDNDVIFEIELKVLRAAEMLHHNFAFAFGGGRCPLV